MRRARLSDDEFLEKVTGVFTELRGYPKSKDCANMVQSWILLSVHGGLPHGCHNA